MTSRPIGVPIAFLLSAVACTAREPNALPPPIGIAPQAEPPGPERVSEPTSPGSLAWQATTASPSPSHAAGIAQSLSALCERADGSLDFAAQRIARRALGSNAQLDPAELSIELRAAGAPYVWSRSWSYAGPALEAGDVQARAERWLSSFRDRGKRTCGAAEVQEAGQTAVALVAVDAPADLEPLPSSARVGQWLGIDAKMLIPASEAKVVVLGPRGAPKTIPTTIHDGKISAKFAPSLAGAWLVQVVASIEGGPRPVLEAYVHTDAPPPSAFQAERAPGESAASGASDAADALFRMINAARTAEGVPALRRDRTLDEAAAEHATAMRDARSLGHNVGKGTVIDRLDARQTHPRAFGENVARAQTPERAHRAIWSSPSHRGNLLDARYDRVGIGTADGPDGVWACEVFADVR